MKNILLLEDDLRLSKTLQEALQDLAQCWSVGSLAAAYMKLESREFDLVIVDRNLPDGDGLEIIEYLCESTYQTKILALTAKNKIHDKIEGLEKGADEYLPKPFSLAELKLRVKKLLYIDKLTSDERLAIGTLEFFPAKGVVMLGSRAVQLRKKEAEILHCLLRYRNQVVTRKMIIDAVWGQSDLIPTETTLDVYIRRIRILLDDYSRAITTIRGFGYRFNDSAATHR